MKNPQQAYRLMKMDAKKRTFVMDGIKYIEEQQEEHLYNYDGASDRNSLRVNLKDIFLSVFATEEIKGDSIKEIVTSWRNNIKASAMYQGVPKEFYFKTWEEIYEPMRQNPYRETLLMNWFRALKDELENQNYHVSTFSPTIPYIKIWWEE